MQTLYKSRREAIAKGPVAQGCMWYPLLDPPLENDPADLRQRQLRCPNLLQWPSLSPEHLVSRLLPSGSRTGNLLRALTLK